MQDNQVDPRQRKQEATAQGDKEDYLDILGPALEFPHKVLHRQILIDGLSPGVFRSNIDADPHLALVPPASLAPARPSAVALRGPPPRVAKGSQQSPTGPAPTGSRGRRLSSTGAPCPPPYAQPVPQARRLDRCSTRHRSSCWAAAAAAAAASSLLLLPRQAPATGDADAPLRAGDRPAASAPISSCSSHSAADGPALRTLRGSDPLWHQAALAAMSSWWPRRVRVRGQALVWRRARFAWRWKADGSGLPWQLSISVK